MPEFRVRNRARLREKDVERVALEIEAGFGARPWPPGAHVDRAESPAGDVLVLGQRILAFLVPGSQERFAPTVRALLDAPPSKGFVTVDMGAVPFVHNGADVMGPGIVDADPAIREGDLVWVRDERNKRPLAVGLALAPAAQLVKQPGKKVRNLHRVGDEIWTWEG